MSSRVLIILTVALFIPGITFGKGFGLESSGDSKDIFSTKNKDNSSSVSVKKTATKTEKKAAAPADNSSSNAPDWVKSGNAIFTDVPAEIIMDKKYVFVIPPLSDNITNKAYNDMLKKLAKKEYIVISNPLDSKGSYNSTIEKLKGNINFLLNGGVPASNIIMIGVREGGSVALRLAAKVNNPDFGYILVSAIPRKNPELLLGEDEKTVSGRFFNIYDRDDTNNGSGTAFFKELKGRRTFGESKLKTGKGEKAATDSLDAWIEQAARWLKN